jgi:dTDP-4-dehydrorhamnose reductase
MNAMLGASPKPAAAPWLVVGADGLIGSALCQRARAEGRPVIGTTRRGAAIEGDGRIHLDLSDDPDAWVLPPSIAAAFLCAGVTGIDACERQPQAARHINVERTCVLADRLLQRGTHVVFLSTNQVFDGTRAHMPADAAYGPRTAYGRLKAATERHLLAAGGAVTVLRLSKVATTLSALLRGWTAMLRSRRAIHPFADMWAAPLAVEFVVEALFRIVDRRVAGVVQASATADVTYADMGRRLAAAMGVDASLVEAIAACESAAAPTHIPRHTTLDSSRLAVELDMHAPLPWVAIDRLLMELIAASLPERAHA